MRVILYALIVKGIIILSLFVFTKSGGKFQKDISMNDTLELKVKVSGEGNPILLVPGGLTGWISWEPFVDFFAAQDRKVIRVQLLNVEYGYENRQLPVNYSVRTESHALAAALDSLKLSKPVDVVAWSYGALVTLDYALDHPNKIRSLTLIEPPAVWVLREQGHLDAETQHTLKFFESLHGDITEDMLVSFSKEVGLAKPGVSPRDLPQWSQWLSYRQALRNSPAIVNHRDQLKRLKEFKKPVLLVKGTGSAPFLHQIIDGLSSNFPNSRVIEMPEGHAPHLVSKDKFLLELDTFQKGAKVNYISIK